MDSKKHEHKWGPRKEVKDKNFDVVFGSYQECECGAIRGEDRAAGRHGTPDRIIRPGKKTKSKKD